MDEKEAAAMLEKLIQRCMTQQTQASDQGWAHLKTTWNEILKVDPLTVTQAIVLMGEMDLPGAIALMAEKWEMTDEQIQRLLCPLVVVAVGEVICRLAQDKLDARGK